MTSSLVCTYSTIIEQLFGANDGSKSARKAELWQVPQGHPNRPFSEILQRGDQGKLGQKVGLLKGSWKKLGANAVKSSLVCNKSIIIGQLFGANGGSKSARKAELWQIPQGHPNRPFSEILQRGDQGKLGQKEGLLKGLEKNCAQIPWNPY